jgi:photosystem II stability/assembly factor-like uncharacterized protein
MGVTFRRFVTGLPLVAVLAAAVALSSCGSGENTTQGSPSPSLTGVDSSTTAWPGGAVWLGANNRVVLRQDDGESVWKRSRVGATSGSLNGLNDIAFPDAAHGWAVGDGGTIIHTADGGRTWAAQESGVSMALDQVTFADSRCGFIVGVDTILATTDAGASWVQQWVAGGLPQSTWIVAVASVDGQRAWAIDDRGGVAFTTDGGNLWERTRVATHADSPCDVAFVDNSYGWIAAVSAVLRTSDGGLTWSRQATLRSVFAIAFADEAHGWSVGDVILRTRDGGSSWQDVTPRRYVNDSVVLLDVAAQDAQRVWVVGSRDTGGGNSRGLVLYSSNGGRRWVDATPRVKGGVPAWITVTVAGD